MLVTLLGLALMPLVFWVMSQPFSQRTVTAVLGYVSVLWSTRFVGPYAEMVLSPSSHVALMDALVVTLGWLAGMLCVVWVAWRSCPYRDVAMLHGDARFATERDVAAMDADPNCKVGSAGTMLHLGYAYGRKLALRETVSAMLIAPPGSGKTAGFVVPALLTTDESCMLVHDPKPELFQICSGWRAQIGACFRLDWSKEDDPANGVFHPKFNFISKRAVPPVGGARDTFVDNLAKILIPESKGGGSNTDYFVNQGRAALVGFTQYLLAHINDRDDPQRYEGLPEHWHGKEASFPMLGDWLAYSQRGSSQGAGAQAQEDPLRPWLADLVETAIERGYPDPCVRGLQPLVLMAPQERSGIIGQLAQALIPFRNTAVVQRTETSDFAPSDLGGRLKASALAELGLDAYPSSREEWDAIAPRLRDDMWEVVTVFVCVNQAVANAFETLTALFFELCSRELIAYAPGTRTEAGAVMGPFSTCFMMDELVKMARCDAVVDGPDLGRGQKRYYVLVAQAIDQIKRRYSDEQRNTIMSSLAVRIVLPQNDANSVEEIAKTVGKTTVKKYQTSRHVGVSMKTDYWSGNRSESTEGVNLLNMSNVGKMKPEHHLLVVQDWLNRPIDCRSCLFFREPELLARAWNPRGRKGAQGLAQALPLPRSLHDVRVARHEAQVREENAAREKAERDESFDAWRYAQDFDALAATPAAGP